MDPCPKRRAVYCTLAEMPASTVRSLMLVLLRWPRHDSHGAWSVCERGEAEIHETLPVAFLGHRGTTG